MRKTPFMPILAWAFALVVVIGYGSCKKSEVNATPENKNDIPPISMQTQSIHNVYLSSYGFLVFPTIEDLDDYQNWVLTHTHSQVQSFLDGLHFTSPGATRYGSGYASDTVTLAQLKDYIVNSDNVMQVSTTIIKPIDETSAGEDWQYILAMTTANLTSSSYSDLVAGTYNGSRMNKFATHQDSTFNLIDFMSNTPTGYEETTPLAVVQGRPMFGHKDREWKVCTTQGEWNGDRCIVRCQMYSQRTNYIFWIGFPQAVKEGDNFPEDAENC